MRLGNGRVGLKVVMLLSTWFSSSRELPPVAEFRELCVSDSASVSVSVVSSSESVDDMESSEVACACESCSAGGRRRMSNTPRPKFWKRKAD